MSGDSRRPSPHPPGPQNQPPSPPPRPAKPARANSTISPPPHASSHPSAIVIVGGPRVHISFAATSPILKMKMMAMMKDATTAPRVENPVSALLANRRLWDCIRMRSGRSVWGLNIRRCRNGWLGRCRRHITSPSPSPLLLVLLLLVVMESGKYY